jgi:hypothetical protein
LSAPDTPTQRLSREETLVALRKLAGRRVRIEFDAQMGTVSVEGVLRAPSSEDEAKEECGNYWTVGGVDCGATIMGYELGESEWVATGTAHPNPTQWGRMLVIHPSEFWGGSSKELSVRPLDDEAPA